MTLFEWDLPQRNVLPVDILDFHFFAQFDERESNGDRVDVYDGRAIRTPNPVSAALASALATLIRRGSSKLLAGGRKRDSMALSLKRPEQPIGEGERAIEGSPGHEHVDQFPLARSQGSVVRLTHAVEMFSKTP